MDNLCHTLTGAAFAEAGLKNRTRFGTATLVVAANLPDVDVLAFLASTLPVALRRGWTHGVLAQALLPVFLTVFFVLLDRLRPLQAERSAAQAITAGPRGVRVGALLLLSYVGVFSHVAMDWLNNYGVRLLMPFSQRWFYGDAVFIVDPWLWLTFGAGVLLARRQHTAKAARVAIAIAAVYVLAMTASARAARSRVIEAWTSAQGKPPAALMVGPVFVNPLRNAIIVDGGDYYQRGTYRWLPLTIEFAGERVAKNDDEPSVQAAQNDPRFRALLVWARFPFYQVEPLPDGTRVTLADMRFTRSLFSATTIVPRVE
jgi:inner membrane protein